MRALTILLSAMLVLVTYVSGCGGESTYVRGDEVPWLDDPAMSTGLDRRDLEQLLAENMDSLRNSSWWIEGTTPGEARSVVAIMPMENYTTEHVEGQLHALIGMMETEVVNSGKFDVVAAELREQILEELNLQQGAEFDRGRAVTLGNQLGVHYYITGRVTDSAERTEDMRRVQYFMFMQVISVSTGAIIWQHESELTKGLIPT